MVVMETLWVASQIVDMIWVGKLGSAAIAGVGVANIVIMLVMSMDMGLVVGVRAMIARFVGAGQARQASHVAGQAVTLGVIWGLLMTVVGLFVTTPLLHFFGVEQEVVSEGAAYLRVTFYGFVTMVVFVRGLYTLQSAGDALTPMVVEAFVRMVHIVLCPFLVLGLWIFPRLGVSGAALSNVIAQTIGAVLMMLILLTGFSRLKLTRGDFRLVPDVVGRLLKIGIPALIMNMQRTFGNFVLTWIIAPFGTLAIAAHSLASRVEMLLYMPAMGLGQGAGVLVGQNLGAREPERAEKGAWVAVAVIEAFMLVCAGVILFFADAVMGIFTPDADLVQLGATFLRIATAAYVVMSLNTVLQNAIAGAGDTMPNMVISIAMIWAVQLPLAYFLPRITDLGVFGVRWAVVAATYAGVLAYLVYFKVGRWKTKKV
jgi:putative MATE family efflux protein